MSAMDTQKPMAMTANDILIKHGPMSGLVRQLQRFALLGWFLFALVLVLHFVLVMLSTMAPRPVVTVNASGQVIGNLEYLSPTARSDDELLAASMRFVQNFMSLNSESIFDDYSQAMNMMAPELFEKTRHSIMADNYLAIVAKSQTRSRIEFGRGELAPRVVERKDLEGQIRLRGQIVVYDARVRGTSSEVKKPFDMTLRVRAVPRNTLNTAGITVMDWRDN